MNTYAIATESNGNIVALNLPPMSLAQAERHKNKLAKLVPESTRLYVINLAAARLSA